MANFQTHLTASTILGIGYGGVAYQMYGVPPAASLLAASLCAVSGMLPDIDSGPGRPLREITTLMAAVVPTMLFGRLQHFGLSQEWIILIGAAIYVAIRFGLAAFLRHYTVHRGMYHSFPAAAIFGELTFLLVYSESVVLRLFIAGGVVAGFLSHLLLDEIYSVQWDGRPRLKRLVRHGDEVLRRQVVAQRLGLCQARPADAGDLQGPGPGRAIAERAGGAGGRGSSQRDPRGLERFGAAPRQPDGS